MKDWREEFVICKHIKEGSRNIRGVNFRVCCEDCYEKGFLKKPLRITSKGLSIGEIAKGRQK